MLNYSLNKYLTVSKSGWNKKKFKVLKASEKMMKFCLEIRENYYGILGWRICDNPGKDRANVDVIFWERKEEETRGVRRFGRDFLKRTVSLVVPRRRKRVIVNLFLHITCNKEAAEISPICITFAFTRSFLADCN